MKVVELAHVRRIREGDRARTDRAAREASIAMKRLVGALRHAPMRPEHREILEAIWAEYYGVSDGAEG